MFKFLERIAKLEKQVKELSIEYYDWVNNRLKIQSEYLEEKITSKFVECEVCGCLLDKNTAIKGKSTVEKESFLSYKDYLSIEDIVSRRIYNASGKEVIKEHYFCKVHGKKK